MTVSMEVTSAKNRLLSTPAESSGNNRNITYFRHSKMLLGGIRGEGGLYLHTDTKRTAEKKNMFLKNNKKKSKITALLTETVEVFQPGGMKANTTPLLSSHPSLCSVSFKQP